MGGVVGGVVGLLALLGLALLCIRRRRRDQQLATQNRRPSPLLMPEPEARFTDFGIAGGDPFASSAALTVSPPTGGLRPLQSWTGTEGGSAGDFAYRDASNASPSFSHARVTSSGEDSAASSVPLSIGVAAATSRGQGVSPSAPQVEAGARSAPVTSNYPNEKAGPASQVASHDVVNTRANPVLTDEQADFVNSLFNNNVPAPVVARVVERMLANPQGANGTGYNDPELRSHLSPNNLPTSSQPYTLSSGVPWQPTMSEFGDGETTIGTAPPSYDYVQAQ